MTISVPRSVVEGFYEAFCSRDVMTMASFLDDDVTWTINGPVDLLQFCGTRRGKIAVLDMFGRQVPAVFRARHVVSDMLLVDGDRAAGLSRLVAVKHDDNRSVNYRAAQFMR